MTRERIRAELAAGVEHFTAASMRDMLAELDACRRALRTARMEAEVAREDLAAHAETVPDAICTLLNYTAAPEIHDALMADALGAARRPDGGWTLRVKGRDVHFVRPSYMWMWDEDG